jgi:hypothetical protein
MYLLPMTYFSWVQFPPCVVFASSFTDLKASNQALDGLPAEQTAHSLTRWYPAPGILETRQSMSWPNALTRAAAPACLKSY